MRRIRGTTARLLCVLLAVAAAGWLGARASDAAGVRLDAGPVVEAFDMPIHLDVKGLYSGEPVTVQATSYDVHGELWKSWAAFTAGGSGTVDLARSVPRQGTYHVADADGLLWSLQSPDAADPREYGFTPGPGAGVRVQVLVADKVVAEQTLIRTFPEPVRELEPVRDGLAGSLFLPSPAPADIPAVVVIGGSEGGIPNTEAAAFTAAGYPSLALGYFGEPGLPACLCSIPLEYFVHAVAWLRAQPGFASRPVVLWGASRGGEGALILASYEPGLFAAVVAVAPSANINGPYGDGAAKAPSAWTLNGQPLTASRIPVTAIRVPVLLTAGGSDAVWDSADAATAVMRQLDALPGAPEHRYLYYPGAGHSTAGIPPYLTINPGRYGGTQDANALAAADAWPQVLAFIAGARPMLPAPAG